MGGLPVEQLLNKQTTIIDSYIYRTMIEENVRLFVDRCT